MSFVRLPARNRNPARGEVLSELSLPAPYKGWNARDPEALMGDGYALSMVNCFPSTADVMLRAGASDHVTGIPTFVKALLSYSPASGAPKLFASTDAGIYDVTTAGVVGATVSTHSNGYVRSINFRTTGSSYLLVWNGTEALRLYNGISWTTASNFPVVTGGTLHAADITAASVFKRRVFFAEKNTLDVYSLPVNSIAGSVDQTPLGGIFSKGGYTIAIGTWTLDGGKGVDDRIVFVSSLGQVAIYAGSDPTNTADWALVGVYDLGAPLGPDCLIKYGGDLLYLSYSGLFPLSKALQKKDVSSAVTDIIRDAFVESARSYGNNRGWCMAIDEPHSLLIVNSPITTLGYSEQFVMNLITNAWCKFQGWNAFAFAYHNSKLYMGMTGKVALAYTGLSDFGGTIVGTAKSAFNYLGTRGRSKHIKLIRPVLKLQGASSVEIAIDVDFRNDAQFGPTDFSASNASLWNAANWAMPGQMDAAVWADNSGIQLDWRSIHSYPAFTAAIRLRLSTDKAKVSWTATDLKYQLTGPL